MVGPKINTHSAATLLRIEELPALMFPYLAIKHAGGHSLNADGSCHVDDPHCSEMQAIHSLHKKLDDDANGNIDFTESTDVSEELTFLLSTTTDDNKPIKTLSVPSSRVEIRFGLREPAQGVPL